MDNKRMFRDEEEVYQEEIEALLELYSFEDILDHNDMSVVEALTKLFLEGYIILPEAKPVK